jgi:hypothetical protein
VYYLAISKESFLYQITHDILVIMNYTIKKEGILYESWPFNQG